MQVNEIISTITPEQNHKIYELMQQAEAECIRFKIIPDFSYFIRKQVHIEYFNDMPVMSLRKEPLEDIGNRINKRAVDILVSLFAIIFILSWLIPVLAILIWLESRGNVFFGQLRSGKNNKSFRCWKFRSMKENIEADSRQAKKGDERLTAVGRFMRKTSLDEFPQFFNVLKGEMSLVGPRPHMLKHTSEYAKLVDQYMVRQFLKPGITGWAQINGFRGEIHGNEQIIGRVKYDIWYSENWSLWLDIKILFLTLYNVIVGDKNAY
jgi:putative colanic acid biosynthesis UDP-glucose lipid carrier transferase